SRVIRISLCSTRDKNVYLLAQDPHDQTCGHREHLRHEIHNLLPPFQNRVWNGCFKMIAWRKHSLVPAGRYFLQRASIFVGLQERTGHPRSFSAFWEATLLANGYYSEAGVSANNALPAFIICNHLTHVLRT